MQDAGATDDVEAPVLHRQVLGVHQRGLRGVAQVLALDSRLQSFDRLIGDVYALHESAFARQRRDAARRAPNHEDGLTLHIFEQILVVLTSAIRQIIETVTRLGAANADILHALVLKLRLLPQPLTLHSHASSRLPSRRSS